MKPRRATPNDAQDLSEILAETFTVWSSDRPSSPEHVLGFYIEHPDSIRCTVIEDEAGRIVGFQSLKLATKGNTFGVAVGHGVIGTYVKINLERRGIGTTIFATTLQAAKQFGLSSIDATISTSNLPALAYYEAIGFQTYRHTQNSISKLYPV